MRATIKDVARAAGVSPSTVSFVINNKPFPISANTREKVLKAVEELHYRPNQLAVGLVTNTTNTIGFILPDSTNPFFATLSNQIEIKLRQKNINIIIGNTNGDPKVTREYLRIFSDRCVDGIILAQLDFEDEEETIKCQDLIDNIDTPVVYTDRVAADRNHFSVMVDQKLVGYLATKHLLEQGHTRIGCASGSIHLNVNSSRYEGYTQALHEHGLSADPDLLFCDSLSIDCGIKALPCLLGRNVTAIFAFNDMIAYGIYKECRSYNLSIPGDLSVVGVDDIALSDIIQPPLTTVAQPVTQIADYVVKGILDLMKNPHMAQEQVKLNPFLKVRASTAQAGVR
jgi:LacI family transcriptional regulator